MARLQTTPGSFRVLESGRYTVAISGGEIARHIPLAGSGYDPTTAFPWLVTRADPPGVGAVAVLGHLQYAERFSEDQILLAGLGTGADTIRVAYQILSPPAGLRVQQARVLVSLPTVGVDQIADLTLTREVDPDRAWPLLNIPGEGLPDLAGLELTITSPTNLRVRASRVYAPCTLHIPYVVLY